METGHDSGTDHPCRSADLVMLDLQYRRHTPEGVVFQEAGLAKQSRQGKPRAEFFFPAFPSNGRLCPQQTLRAYARKTEPFCTGGSEEQTRLFLAVVRPHKPVWSSTLARWLRSLLDKAGIDTAIFKAHSTRSAAALAAANAGITTGDILKALPIPMVTKTEFYFMVKGNDPRWGKYRVQTMLTRKKTQVSRATGGF